MFEDLRNLDPSDIGSAPTGVKNILLGVLLVVIVAAGYYLSIRHKWDELEVVKQDEFALRADFEAKQQKAANLEAYEQQLVEMQDLLETMFRQLPSRTEMDKLLVDVSQTALAAGID